MNNDKITVVKMRVPCRKCRYMWGGCCKRHNVPHRTALLLDYMCGETAKSFEPKQDEKNE